MDVEASRQLPDKILHIQTLNKKEATRAEGRRLAKDCGLVIGRPREMGRHLSMHCGGAPNEIKEWASALNAKPKNLEASAASGISLLSARASSEQESCPPSKRQKTPATNSGIASVKDFSVHGPLHRYNRKQHNRLLAELLAVEKVPFRFLESESFRNLQAFYVGGRNILERDNLLIYARKIRKEVLTPRFEMAKLRISETLKKHRFRETGCSLHDDGWVSRAKEHFSAVCVGAPSADTDSVTVAVCPISETELHGVAVAKNWERLLLLAANEEPLSEYPEGFFGALPSQITSLVCDDASVNNRARRILSLRFPNLILLPCYAHCFALVCGDLLKSKSAPVMADAAFLVTFFNNSSNKWLPILRQEMIEVYGKSTALVNSCVTRWTSTWLSYVSLLQVKTAFERVPLNATALPWIQEANGSNSKRHVSLKRAIGIIRDHSFKLQEVLGKII